MDDFIYNSMNSSHLLLMFIILFINSFTMCATVMFYSPSLYGANKIYHLLRNYYYSHICFIVKTVFPTLCPDVKSISANAPLSHFAN